MGWREVESTENCAWLRCLIPPSPRSIRRVLWPIRGFHVNLRDLVIANHSTSIKNAQKNRTVESHRCDLYPSRLMAFLVATRWIITMELGPSPLMAFHYQTPSFLMQDHFVLRRPSASRHGRYFWTLVSDSLRSSHGFGFPGNSREESMLRGMRHYGSLDFLANIFWLP